uniref:Cyclin N-terminal domain-containing protein n=1 Tax=Compsopogon caeruleus TaxID=31354 RepID=A0A7S1TC36_9RHOD|mmetsp:Transcript_16135/g.32657  ORF Transcript_16135/g.32657 Transcript_16135/m.32657 type:complete len:194 (+) Transcript_16135:89-670(+)
MEGTVGALSERPRQAARLVAAQLQSLVSDVVPSLGSSTVFDAFHPLRTSVATFVKGLFLRITAVPGLHIIALLLVRRMAKVGIPVTTLNAHRLYLTALLLAIKTYSDLQISVRVVANAGGMSHIELSRLEIEFLKALQFDLFIVQELDDYMLTRAEPQPTQDSERKGCATLALEFGPSPSTAISYHHVAGPLH